MFPSVFLIWFVSCAYFQGFFKQYLAFSLLRVRWCFPLWSVCWLCSLQLSEMLLVREPPPALCCLLSRSCLPILHQNVSTHPLLPWWIVQTLLSCWQRWEAVCREMVKCVARELQHIAGAGLTGPHQSQPVVPTQCCSPACLFYFSLVKIDILIPVSAEVVLYFHKR